MLIPSRPFTPGQLSSTFKSYNTSRENEEDNSIENLEDVEEETISTVSQRKRSLSISSVTPTTKRSRVSVYESAAQIAASGISWCASVGSTAPLCLFA